MDSGHQNTKSFKGGLTWGASVSDAFVHHIFAVENLTAKVKAWEMKKGISFLYDKALHLCMLEEYIMQCWEKEEEKHRSREQTACKNSLLQSKSPIRFQAFEGFGGLSMNANTLLGTPTGHRWTTLSSCHRISGGKEKTESMKVTKPIPLNYVALSKDDLVSSGN